MDEKDRQKTIQRIVYAPQSEISQLDIQESGAIITIDADIKSQRYATKTGQRLFVPICPLHRGYTVPTANADRKEDIWRDLGYLDEDDITIAIPEGFEIEARPKDITLEQPFGSFTFTMQVNDGKVRIHNRLLMKSGTFPKSLFPQLADFIRTISGIYNQKIVVKKKSN